MPNLYDRHILYRTGIIQGIIGNGSVPNIKGEFAFSIHNTGTWLHPDAPSGAFAYSGSYGNTAELSQLGTFQGNNKLLFDASRYSPVFRNNTSSVYARHLQLNAIIKY